MLTVPYQIETTLRKLEGFDGTTVSFSTGTIVIPAGRREIAEDTISKIEPDARIVERENNLQVNRTGNVDDYSLRPESSDKRPFFSGVIPETFRHIGRIVIALILTVIGVIFNDALHATPLHLGEYAVFLAAYLLVGWPVLSSAVRNIVHGRVFDEMFLMSIATLGAIVPSISLPKRSQLCFSILSVNTFKTVRWTVPATLFPHLWTSGRSSLAWLQTALPPKSSLNRSMLGR